MHNPQVLPLTAAHENGGMELAVSAHPEPACQVRDRGEQTGACSDVNDQRQLALPLKNEWVRTVRSRT